MQDGVKKTCRWLAGLAALVVFITSFSVASAVTPATGVSNLTTSPISADLNIAPGTSASTTLQVENNGPRAISVAVELKTFRANGVTGQAAIVTPPANDPSPSYVHFSQNSLTLQPGVFTPIQMTVALPVSADLGYYYAVLFQPILSTGGTSNTNKVTLSNAILVLVDSGSANEKRSLQVASFTASKKVYEYLPANLSVTVRNNGNIYLPPEGTIYISRQPTGGNVLATLSLNKSGGRVLPSSSRTFTVSWDDGFPSYQTETLAGQPVLNKKGQPIQQLKWNFSNTNHFRFGKYYARLALVYSNGQRDVPIYGLVSFWVIPWKLILAVIILIAIPIVLLVLALRYRRLYKRMKQTTKASGKESS
jgi:hypothetical protein